MIFHEMYGCYYNSVAEILKLAVKNKLTEENMLSIIRQKAFPESELEIKPALDNQDWQLLNSDYSTPLKHEPTLPLTILEKRWLKAISLDDRIQLFNVNFDFLGDVEPLFTNDDYYIFDQYTDGDPYTDENYIKNFQTVLQAIHCSKKLEITYTTRKGKTSSFHCDPYELEYSEKDDKFRVYVASCRSAKIINMAMIHTCRIAGDAHYPYIISEDIEKHFVTFELNDVRNSLERVMLHFANFEKEAERINDRLYKVKVFFYKIDEAELVIRILSFGPTIKVIEPDEFVELIRDKLRQQYLLENE